jgi:hypothetical protein
MVRSLRGRVGKINIYATLRGLEGVRPGPLCPQAQTPICRHSATPVASPRLAALAEDPPWTPIRSDLQTQLPSAAMLRARDRNRLLVQLMASVWENILQLPAQTRDTTESHPPKPTDAPLVSAAVRVTGGWEGLLLLTAGLPLAVNCTPSCVNGRPTSGRRRRFGTGWGAREHGGAGTSRS